MTVSYSISRFGLCTRTLMSTFLVVDWLGRHYWPSFAVMYNSESSANVQYMAMTAPGKMFATASQRAYYLPTGVQSTPST